MQLWISINDNLIMISAMYYGYHNWIEVIHNWIMDIHNLIMDISNTIIDILSV